MFPDRYFAARLFPNRYWPTGAIVPGGYFPDRYFPAHYFPNRYWPLGAAVPIVATAPGGGKIRLIYPFARPQAIDDDDEAIMTSLLLAIEELM